MYVIQRIPDGAYVARPGSGPSYTRFLERAQIFSTREQAEVARCPGNEHVADLGDVIRVTP